MPDRAFRRPGAVLGRGLGAAPDKQKNARQGISTQLHADLDAAQIFEQLTNKKMPDRAFRRFSNALGLLPHLADKQKNARQGIST